VAIVIATIAVLAIYLGIKLVPVWWQAREVDEAIESFQHDASMVSVREADHRDQQIVDDLFQKTVDLGVDESSLEVYWGPNYTSLHVEYTVEVGFPFGLHRSFHFHRHADVEPRDL